MLGVMVGNLDKDTVRWIIDGLVGALAFVGGFWLTNLTNRLDSNTRELSTCVQRVAVLEAHDESETKRLDRFESKLDDILKELKRR